MTWVSEAGWNLGISTSFTYLLNALFLAPWLDSSDGIYSSDDISTSAPVWVLSLWNPYYVVLICSDLGMFFYANWPLIGLPEHPVPPDEGWISYL